MPDSPSIEFQVSRQIALEDKKGQYNTAIHINTATLRLPGTINSYVLVRIPGKMLDNQP